MCQVHTGVYISLLAPGKTDYKKDDHVYITRSTLSLRIRTSDASQLEKKKQRKGKKRKKRIGKERKESEKGKE